MNGTKGTIRNTEGVKRNSLLAMTDPLMIFHENNEFMWISGTKISYIWIPYLLLDNFSDDIQGLPDETIHSFWERVFVAGPSIGGDIVGVHGLFVCLTVFILAQAYAHLSWPPHSVFLLENVGLSRHKNTRELGATFSHFFRHQTPTTHCCPNWGSLGALTVGFLVCPDSWVVGRSIMGIWRKFSQGFPEEFSLFLLATWNFLRWDWQLKCHWIHHFSPSRISPQSSSYYFASRTVCASPPQSPKEKTMWMWKVSPGLFCGWKMHENVMKIV